MSKEGINPYAAGLSVFVSIVSALTVIGLPAEVYISGNGMFWRILGGFIGSALFSKTILPIFHKLQAYSVYT